MTVFGSSSAFRQALEERLRQRKGADVGRLRKRLAMERLLARLQDSNEPPWILKGGVALELRLQDQARTTADLDVSIDLEIVGPSPTVDQVLEQLTQATLKTLPDFFRFEVAESAGLKLGIDGLAIHRFGIISHLAGRVFDRFRVDLITEPAENAPSVILPGSGFLTFAGIEREKFHVIALERHLAEKIHAYSRPREVRTRVKDLIDILLIGRIGILAPDKVNREVSRVFDQRRTHPVPISLPDPPPEWKVPFELEARRTGLGAISIEEASERANQIWLRICR